MTASSIVMMIVTILLVWGGLVASIVALKVLPVPGDDEASRDETSPSTPLRSGSVPDNI
ncbi:methionine/alanine import family NSS transporter small subunit [Schaalia suimastitidis]|uniref:methionine/alanine import family NSS transporter small subunit n=1 Tax=Schaalia suimastitidis TaxID=121163 RepID=UPI0003F6D28D|nr:methionine/alanine import family NSS transporter small subunit [Schaalia suimastitidis]